MSDIQTFIDQVTRQDFAKAGPLFSELLQAKVTDALDAERVKLADQIYNGASDQQETEDGDIELEADENTEITSDDIDDDEDDDEDEEEEQ